MLPGALQCVRIASRRFCHQMLRSASRTLSGSPKVSSLPMFADSQEVGRRCEDFLQVCNDYGGDGMVELTKTGSIAEIKLNNYPKKNALSGKMMLDLEKIITDLENWPDGKAVLLYGEKDTFCSGGDLDFVLKIATPDLGAQMSHFMQHTLNRLSNLPMIVVAVIKGVAYGGGAELATAADFRVFARTADVRFVQSKLGITTGWGGASRLSRLVGPKMALYHLISTIPINMSNARALGFAELVFKDAEAMEMAKLWLSDNFLNSPVDVIRAYKSCIRRNENATLAESYESETQAFRKTWGSPVHVKAVTDIINKRGAPA